MKFYGGGGNKKRIAKHEKGRKKIEPLSEETEEIESFYEEPAEEEPVREQETDLPVSEELALDIPEVLTPKQERLRIKQEKKQTKREKKVAKKLKKKQRTPAQKRRRVILVLVILLAIFAGGAAAWHYYVQPPDTGMDKGQASMDGGDALTIQGENRKEDYFTFFIGATDEDGTRTDSMMMVSMNIAEGEVNVLNIPRDTMSDVSRKNKKINSAYSKGIEGTRKEINKLLGFDFDKYIVFSFDAIAEFVDIIGGIDYEVPFYMYYDDPSQDLHIHFEKGKQHMDGQQVVEFLRWRKNNDGTQGTGTSGGDMDRIQKQQEFLKTLAAEFMTPANIVKIPEMAQCIKDNVESDITKGQLVWLGIQAVKIGASHINMFVLPGEPRYIDNLSYYVGFEDETLEILNEYFNPYTYKLTAGDLDIISPSSTGKLTSPTRDNDDLGAITGEDNKNEVTSSRKNTSSSKPSKTVSKNSNDDDNDGKNSSSSSGSSSGSRDEDPEDSDSSSSSGSGSGSSGNSGSHSSSGSGSGSSSNSGSHSSSGSSSGNSSNSNSSSGSSGESGGSGDSGSSTPVDPEL